MEKLIRQVDPQKLRTARMAAGLTQQQVADHFGVCKSQITHIERGFSGIDSNRLMAWADLCGVCIVDLFSFAPANAFRIRPSLSKKSLTKSDKRLTSLT
jgi:transcriptional regulator with XRE-family HTH domain